MMDEHSAVGVYAPYTKQDATVLALRFCRILAIAKQDPVLGYYGRRKDIEPTCDHQPNYAPGPLFLNFAAACKHIIWFDIQPHKLKMAKRLGVRNTLFFIWNRYTPEQLFHLYIFHRVVFPYYEPKIFAESSGLLDNEGWILPAYPDMPVTAKQGASLSSPIKYFIPVPRRVSVEFGRFLVDIVRTIATEDQLAKITLCPTKTTFPNTIRSQLTKLENDFRGRFSVVLRRGYNEYSALLAKHDWLIWPDRSDCTGLTILEANACQLPVVAFNIPPASELVDEGKTGCLVECDVGFSRTGQPFVLEGERQFLRKLAEIAGNRQLLTDLRSQVGEARALADANYASLALSSLLVP